MRDITDPIHFEALYPETSRSEQVKQISEYLKAGNSCQLIALPGVGRSNVFALLSYNRNARTQALGENQKWYHFVYMDFSEVKKRNLYDVVKFIIISISYSLSERNLKEEQAMINSYLKEALDFHDELILFQALKKSIDYLAIEKELSVILLFDRFDQYIPDITHEFFENLKILRNRAKYRFAAIFSLSRPLEETIEPEFYADFYEFLIGNHVYLPLFDPEGIAFRFAYLERIFEKKVDDALKTRLLELTGGHGKLSRVSYELLLATNDKTDTKSLEKFLLEKIQVKGVLYEIWNSLNPEEQGVVRDGKSESANKGYLEKIGLLEKGKVTIPLLTSFVDTLPQKSKSEIKIDPEHNDIMQGGESLTDKLSPSEFRLLKYLLENSGKVCEKDDIIIAVWKDAKTQEGVTDQALDQIVYRLRKKIESDPNNPTHILTIKGRGYRFSS